jgi:hypothetical protein
MAKTSIGWSKSIVQVGEPEFLVSKQEYAGRFRLHAEFRLPPRAEPNTPSPVDGGIWLQGRYRVRIADSHGQPLDGTKSCGAIHTVAAPKGGNACRRPGVWQSLDLEFTAPVVQDGQVKRPAKLSVWHNDFQVHSEVLLASPTPGPLDLRIGKPGPIVLADGGGQIEFRNVCLLPLPEAE